MTQVVITIDGETPDSVLEIGNDSALHLEGMMYHSTKRDGWYWLKEPVICSSDIEPEESNITYYAVKK